MLLGFLTLVLPCASMSAVCIVVFLLWYAAAATTSNSLSKAPPQMGFSQSDLQKLPTITGQGLVFRVECAVCLDEIGPSDPARLLPGCNHGSHLQWVETWLFRLSKHSTCPLCRSKIEPGNEKDNPC